MTHNLKTPPLVILGLDAADPDFVLRWARAGELPSIASLMKEGSWGKISGPELVCEHGIWVSLLSGVSRSEHGYYFFRQLKPGTYDLKTVDTRDLGVTPFWASLNRPGAKVAVIDVPDSCPQKGLDGIQLSNWATHDNDLPARGEPPELLKQVQRHYGPQRRVEEVLNSSLHKDLKIYRRLTKRIEKKGSLCRALIQGRHYDLIAIVFSESHTATHQFWEYRPEFQKDGKRRGESELTHGIKEVYRAIDRQIGLLLAELPRAANVFIVSSTGMQDMYPSTGIIEDFCRQLDYQVRRKPEPLIHALTKPMDLLRRTFPESWRIALSRYLSREKQEALLAEQFRRNTDWSKTTAFAIPSLFTSFLRVNLKGREPEGIVEPGPPYEALLDRLETDLKQLIDPETGEPAAWEIQRTNRIFGGGPPLSLPDLFINWKSSSHFTKRLLHPRAVLTQKKPLFFRGTDHSHEGLIVASGPGIQKKGWIGDLSLLDLAPTFLSLLGETIPNKLSGRAIENLVGSRCRVE